MASRILSVLLGLFYLMSGIGKLLNVGMFTGTLWSYGVPGEALAYVGVLVPPLEILLGLGFLLFVRTRILGLFSAILLLLFTVGFAYAHFAKGVNDCGCFGMVTALATPPVVSLARNIVAIVLSLYLFRKPVSPPGGGTPRWKGALLCVAGGVSFGLSGMSVNEALWNPEPYLHKRVDETPFGAMVRTHPDSTYLFFIMNVNCSHCWNATENVKAYKRLGRVDEIIAFAIGTDSAAAVYREHFAPNFELRMTEWKKVADLAGGGVPKVFFVRNDSIVYTPPGVEIPSPWSLEFEIKPEQSSATGGR